MNAQVEALPVEQKVNITFWNSPINQCGGGFDAPVTLSQIAERPTHVNTTREHYLSLTTKEEKNKYKIPCHWFIGGQVSDGYRKKSNVQNRTISTIDVDDNTLPLDEWVSKAEQRMNKMLPGIGWAWYESISSSEEKARVRVLITYDDPITTEADYERVQTYLCESVFAGLGATLKESKCYAQAMFLRPQFACGNQGKFKSYPGAPLKWRELPTQEASIFEISSNSAPKNEKDSRESASSTEVLEDPRLKPGLIGAFCRVFSCRRVLDEYLSTVWKRDGEHYTLLSGSNIQGGKLYNNEMYFYSHHGSDVNNNGHCKNAYDLLKDYLFNGDIEATNGHIKNLASVQAVLTNDQTQTAETVNALLGDEWAEPLDWWGSMEPPMLDVNLLPDGIGAFVKDQSELIGVDPGVIGLSALVCAGSAIHDSIKIQCLQHATKWKESARLWGCVVGDPSTKKSPGLELPVEAVRAFDDRIRSSNIKAKAEYEEALTEYKLLKPEDRQGKQSPQPPILHRGLISDITTEALGEKLAYTDRGVLCFRDELAGWIGSMDAYSKSSGKDRGAWLQAYNGGSHQIDRIRRGDIYVNNFSVSMLGGIQPDALAPLAKNLGKDGLLQRFLIVCARPKTKPIDRPEDYQALSDWENLMQHLFAIEPPQSDKSVVKLSPEAAQVSDQVRGSLHELSMAKTLGTGLSAHLGKLEGLFSRLLLIYHCCELWAARDTTGNLAKTGLPAFSNTKYPTDVPVSKQCAEKVSNLIFYFLIQHAIHFYGSVSVGKGNSVDHAEWLSGYILSRGLKQISKRDITRAYKPMRGDVGALKETLITLETSGWVRPSAKAKVGTDGVATLWDVNPKVHELFAEVAKREAAEREATKQLIALKAEERRKENKEAISDTK